MYPDDDCLPIIQKPKICFGLSYPSVPSENIGESSVKGISKDNSLNNGVMGSDKAGYSRVIAGARDRSGPVKKV